MPARKIYVRPDDADTWTLATAQAQECGLSLSAYVTAALRAFLRGNERLRVVRKALISPADLHPRREG